jgi:hypothetical protein
LTNISGVRELKMPIRVGLRYSMFWPSCGEWYWCSAG